VSGAELELWDMASNKRPIGTTRLEQLRRFRRLTQQQTADAAGVPRRIVQQLEGGYCPPRSAAAERLAAHLGYSVAELVERPGPSERLLLGNRAPAPTSVWDKAQSIKQAEGVTA
jgi:transcriptional regulator with XRE-family HTH domain